MEGLGKFIKSIVRPFLVFTSWPVLLLMWYKGMEIPDVLLLVATAIVGIYFVERSIKRFKE